MYLGLLIVLLALSIDLSLLYEADSESYTQLLFNNLNRHLNTIKEQKDNCDNIPLSQTILSRKYFNPEFIYYDYKTWNPPKEHESNLVWTQLDTKRQSLLLSYLLQNENSLEPPGWLYLYLTQVAQLHSLQQLINEKYDIRKEIVKSIKLPFESNEVFKVNWFKNNGKYQKFNTPFALYTTKPNKNEHNFVRVVDFSIGNYSFDYTGHAFIGVYLNDYLANQSFSEYRRPVLRLLDEPHEELSRIFKEIRHDNGHWDPLIKSKDPDTLRYDYFDGGIRYDNSLKWTNYQSLPSLDYIETYRYAKVWWLNETHLRDNKREYYYKIRDELRQYRYVGADKTLWSQPYFWCTDPNNWLVALMSPIWADNDFVYKNKLFYSSDRQRFIGLSEIVLDYEKVDVDQCAGDRKRNVFASTTICDSYNTKCKPLTGYGLFNGAYECSCLNGYNYPLNVDGPYKGYERGAWSLFKCDKTQYQLQYPNWVYREKRFLDRRKSFEKLRDLIFNTNHKLECKLPSQDVVKLSENDERFIINLKTHADQVFKAQMAQAIRLAHLISAYLQLQNKDILLQERLGLNKDQELNERLLIGELITILQTQYPIIEAQIAFNGSEFNLQKYSSSQETLNFALNAYKTNLNDEIIVNRTNDNSHLTREWYKYASLQSTQKLSSLFDINRYSVEFNLRTSFDKLSTFKQPLRFYDAAKKGIWFGPYYDCQKESNSLNNYIRMSYIVPIIISSLRDNPVGFVSISIGSQLKWWKINPCELTNTRNIFQNENKCDLETTKCEFNEDSITRDNLLDTEQFYLTSYKCVCKKNYEFPFKDYEFNYFDGLLVEKEYEKKLKGQANIYDRLKCRPIWTNPRYNIYNRTNLTLNNPLLIVYLIFYLILFNT